MELEFKKITVDGMEDVEISIHTSIGQIAEEWDRNCGDNVYVQSRYLGLLESSGPIGYRYFYVFVRWAGIIIGLVYCQNKHVNLGKDFRVHAHGDGLWEATKVNLTKVLFKRIRHEMLICGNVLLTGEYGIRLDEAFRKDSHILIPPILEAVVVYAKEELNIKINSTLLKDFYQDSVLKKIGFHGQHYTKFAVQPDMVITLDPAWTSYPDYLASVKSKYRVKFKKIKKRGKGLVFRELDGEAAREYNSDMYKMYTDTADRATFSLFLLAEDYFSKVKNLFGDEMKLQGVFLEDRMVAFFTYIKNGEQGDAHFLGYDVKLNAQHQIYFNILLSLVETAIEDGAKYLNLSRTALEIKSSVGAEPHEMDVHLKYHNNFINRFLPSLLKRFVPQNEWLPRSPFK